MDQLADDLSSFDIFDVDQGAPKILSLHCVVPSERKPEVEHTVHAFDAEFRDLSLKIAEMGSFAEQQVADAIDALIKRDAELAKRIMAAGRHIDALQQTIGEKAVVAMARRQPVGSDLREIVGSLRISNDLAHIGNLAQSNARRVLTLADGLPSNEPLLQIERMAKLVLKQLRDVFHSYVHRDVAQALEVWRTDQEIDALYSSLFRELLTHMMEDTHTITICTQLLFCAKNIERTGDHVTNIAETNELVHAVVPQRAAFIPRNRLNV